MGVAIAGALAAQGCRVRVLAGPCQPAGLDSLPDVKRFRTAEELRALVGSSWPEFDLLFMAAAVADWRPVAPRSGKARREDGPIRIELEPVPEILGTLVSRPDQFVVGFALEPAEALAASARRKLDRKRADCIVANPLETMDADVVDGVLLWPDATQTPPGGACSKVRFAEWLVERVLPAANDRCGIR
jgi:phosphopantothenoylcysteine decarboxylase/phosphopantothenate--cysteine ligase